MIGHIENFEYVRHFGNGVTFLKSAGFVRSVFGVIVLACWLNAYSGELYVIAGADTVFVGSDFLYYDVSTSDLGFTEAGRARWLSRLRSENYVDRKILKLSKLTGREFVLEIDGEVISVGHFSSVVSSRLHPGLVIWDSLIRPDHNSISLGYAFHDGGNEMTDPRESEKFLNYFRSQDKLVDSGRER